MPAVVCVVRSCVLSDSEVLGEGAVCCVAASFVLS